MKQVNFLRNAETQLKIFTAFVAMVMIWAIFDAFVTWNQGEVLLALTSALIAIGCALVIALFLYAFKLNSRDR